MKPISGKDSTLLPTEFLWSCKNCQQGNIDDFKQVSTPTCTECGEQYQWEEIASREQIGRMLKAWKESKKT